jgi:hypothetical protein
LSTASYAVGDFVVQNGVLYQAKVAVPPGAFDTTQWVAAATLTDLQTVTTAYTAADAAVVTGYQTADAAIVAAYQATDAGIMQGVGYRNRIINGDMIVDQRNAGLVRPTLAGANYVIDRWKHINNVGAPKGSAGRVLVSSVAPLIAGLTTSYALQWQTTVLYTPVTGDALTWIQTIEALDFSDVLFGTSSAKPLTLTFYACASVAGTYSGSLRNNGATRSFIFTYVISAVNTWQKFRISIPGDISGVWTGAPNLSFSIATGATFSNAVDGNWLPGNYVARNGTVQATTTNGSTLNITNVGLMVGSVPSQMEPSFPNLSTALRDCQRFYEKSYDYAVLPGAVVGVNGNGMVLLFYNNPAAPGTSLVSGSANMAFKATKRTAPVMTFYSPVTGVAGMARDRAANLDVAIGGGIGGENAFYVFGPSAVVGTSLNLGICWTADADF